MNHPSAMPFGMPTVARRHALAPHNLAQPEQEAARAAFLTDIHDALLAAHADAFAAQHGVTLHSPDGTASR